MEQRLISFITFGLCYLIDYGISEYTVKVSIVSEMVNQGEDYVAYCNIPGMGALDIIQNLKVQWLHNGQLITEYCDFCNPELTTKYSCRILSTQSKNFSLELTISDIQPEDAGTLECNVLQKIWDKRRLVRYDSVAKLPFSIQVREPIKTMVFRFDSSFLTQADSDAPYRVEVPPGNYSPSCSVNGSIPLADVTITMGDTQIPGIIVEKNTMKGTLFVANEAEFIANTRTKVKCTSKVPGLSNSTMERIFAIIVRSSEYQ
uniref:Uncharacterized protein LOC111115966 n=1 Tax=Crassostrea virginica TaxID=6565 RepID=A0A8B8C659_CRAVI|nr:uncharacterized protein LOC111115966 [Crassostrea virginica]